MDVPDNLKNQLNTFKSKMSSLKSECQTFLQKYDSMRLAVEGNALEEAALDLTTAFTINSLFWLYLTCKGLDPKNHDLRLEINRIKQANLRLKKLQESHKAPKINVPAARRFIRSALFDPESEMQINWGSSNNDSCAMDKEDEDRKKRKRIDEEKGKESSVAKMEDDKLDGEDADDDNEDSKEQEQEVKTNSKTSPNERIKDGLNTQQGGGGNKQEERSTIGSINDHKKIMKRKQAQAFRKEKAQRNSKRKYQN